MGIDSIDGASLNRQNRINQLPRDVRLIGRDQELAELRRSLRPVDYLQSATISPISGLPGVGKSALAIHFAHTLEKEYPFGAFYADFLQQAEGLEPLSASQVLRRFMAEFMAPADIPEGLDEMSGRWQTAIQGHRAIILLDNVNSYEQIRPIIPHSRSCHVIVTSHVRLGDLQVGTLPLRPLGMEHAVELYDLIAEHTTARVGKDDELRKVLESCGGLPLPIRVLAARMSASPNLSLASVQDALRDNAGLSRALGPGQDSVAASFRVAYDALGLRAKRLFRRLGAVPGESFQPQLAAHLGETSLNEAVDLLESLEQRQFVLRSRDEQYFYLHSIVRRFAIEQLEKDEGDENNSAQLSTLGRILDHYQEKVSQLQQSADASVLRLGAPTRQSAARKTQDPGLSWVGKERFNLVAAVQQACDSRYVDKAWRLAVALGDYFEIRSDWENWKATHEAALGALQYAVDAFGRAKVQQGLGRMHRGLGNTDEAVRCYRQALAVFRLHGPELEIALTLLALGDVYRYARAWDPARNCLEQSHRILEDLHQRRALAIVKRSLGALDRLKGDWQAAERYYLDATAMLEELGDKRWVAATRLSLADVYLDRGNSSKAAALLEECLTEFERIGDTHWQALTLRSLGEALRMQQRFAEARERLERSRELLEATGEILWQAQVVHSLGLVYLNERRGGEALSEFDTCLKIFEDKDDSLWEARTYVSIGAAKALIHQEDGTAEVREWLARAWPIFVEQGAEEDLKNLNERLDLLS
ncbi:tetratricopeptide repeat protein [Catellatospora chokoriensis]|uniref:Tetratricopeptide repeat protein n=1 Tax=Catellatospora chokoriensis TaxID=310353 RepID=A0A8J3K735_9ACTN|nr:tetratricopeptide repeat protein [Catellatospora chokoriensis]GIF94366.1 hypothetical protein Cch02nite_78100 [Catellatospora chokoriensis]